MHLTFLNKCQYIVLMMLQIMVFVLIVTLLLGMHYWSIGKAINNSVNCVSHFGITLEITCRESVAVFQI